MSLQRGALDYMAPELLGQPVEAAGKSSASYPVTKAVDICSFGILLWEIVTGEKRNRAAGSLRKPR